MLAEVEREIAGFQDSPEVWLEQTFGAIGESEMSHLPFYRPHLPVKAIGFQRFDNQWLGALLTPWMLNLVILPGRDQIWPVRTVGQRLTLALPQKDITFQVGETPDGNQYLASSLLSPLPATMSAQEAISLAQDSLRLALSLPMRTRSEVNHSLRALLRGRMAD